MNDTKTMKDSSSKRRRFFQRAGVFAAVAAIAGGIGMQVQAHGGPGFRGGFFDGTLDAAQIDDRVERMLKHLAVEINATPEQQQKLAPIVKAAIRDLQPLRSQMQAARKQAIEIMSAEQIDRGAIERMRLEKLQTADALSRRVTQALADAAEVLTPAQRADLAKRMERHRGMRHHG